MLEAYSGCIYYSIKLEIGAVGKSAKEYDEVRQHLAEAHRYLLLTRANSTDHDTIEMLSRSSDEFDKTWDKSPELAEAADSTALAVGQLLKNDHDAPEVVTVHLAHADNFKGRVHKIGPGVESEVKELDLRRFMRK